MDNVPISGLPELHAHLQELVNDAALPINAKLLDDVELQLTEDNIPPLLPTLLPPLSQILRSTSQDPTPLLSLTIKLLTPLSLPQALALADPPSLLTALRSPLPGANLLALAILHKAAGSAADAALLSTLPEVVEELVRRWLESPDVGVGERAAKVLGDMLEVDCDVVEANGCSASQATGSELVKRRAPGHARLWHLILQSRPNLSLIQYLCTPDEKERRSMRDVTISQGRVLRLLPRLCALNIGPLSQTLFADIFLVPAATARETGQGLLQWAALAMVDKSDVLMHLNLIDFFETLVSIIRVSDSSPRKHVTVKNLVKAAVRADQDLESALRTLPDRTVEEEAEALRRYIVDLLA
ncbi:hypothetical protein CDD83_7588 [Cordyceps sp. RAO-2017]|nr:hypothetical protein CDD83_7588 [Cordyceps sp. RAO-2017]